MTRQQMETVKDEARSTIDEAIEFAVNSPDPTLDELYTDIWVDDK